ncbi:Annexin like [Actinidia chinensis var. chinensis]|uniref:Annexin n=1 Tax=Actinidia chinensis var. chinensis TaxID=1590841 RepID=A0A2R6QHF8_ACTCC|nr:Annexin like [Actinidia chinensis var. chinensis]
MSTLTVPTVPPSPRDDAIQLYRAFKGLGCDSEAVVNIIAHRDATQRALIQQEYRTMYSEDLLKRLSSELSGKLEKAVLLWMHDPAGRDAIIVKQSLSGDTHNLEAGSEIICSRTPSQIQTLKQIYYSMFGVYVERDIEYHTSGDHSKLLLAYVTTPRSEGLEVDRQMVAKDAKSLFKAGEKKLGTDEKTFIHIFSERSRAHLAAIDSAYHDMYGTSLKKAVKSETSGKFELALLTILQCALNPAKYFAKVLHKAMKGLGTDDMTLTRVVVTRAEMDMQYIKGEYHRKHHKTLNDAVRSETSGHYRSFLLSLLGPNH